MPTNTLDPILAAMIALASLTFATVPFTFQVNGTVRSLPGTTNGLPFVADNATLQTLASTYSAYVLRADHVIGARAAPVVYVSSTSACSLNAGAGDNGSQVRTSAGKCWPLTTTS